MRKIPPVKYYFSSEGINEILEKFREILETGAFLTMGRYCEEFEREFANYVGSRYAVSVNSGTSALEAIFSALSINGFDVVVPTNTFAATAFAVIRAGGRPIFADCTNDLTVDLEDVKRRLTSKTKAVVTVHVGGLVSPRTYELLDECKKRGIYLVEDAAHAHGSMLGGKKAGSLGVAGAFSFFPTKVMTTGEGGMIVTDDEEICEKTKLLRDQAKVDGRNYHEEVGYNWRMTELQALMGLAQLRLIEEMIERRANVAKIYDELLRGLPLLQPLEIPRDVRHNYYKYIVFLPKGRNPELLGRHLKEKCGVNLSGYVYDVPLHCQPVFQEYVDESNGYPIADDLCTRHIALPVYPQMNEEEARYVVESLRRVLKDPEWM